MMQMGKENKSDHGAPEVLRDKTLQAVRLQQQVQVGFVGVLEHQDPGIMSPSKSKPSSSENGSRDGSAAGPM